jgi:hypothetical protein
VCPLVPANFKCTRCGLSKKACTCEGAFLLVMELLLSIRSHSPLCPVRLMPAPKTCDVAVQCEMDEDMTTRAIDLSVQVRLKEI